MLLNRLVQSLDNFALVSSPIIRHTEFLDGQDGNCFTISPYFAQNQSCHISQKAVWEIDIPLCCHPRVVRHHGF